MTSRTALFGRPQQPQTRHLLQFKAGKMTVGDNNWVHADPRKGWVYVYQAADGKLHFCWIDRKTCLVEDNFVITPKQAEFKRVPQCTSGRVYLLKFKGPKRFFIWMQEPNGKNDSDICTRINNYIKSPPSATSSNDWLTRLGGLDQLSHNDLLTLLSMGVGLGSGVSSEPDVSSAQATSVTIGRHLNTGHIEEPTLTSSLLGTAGATTTTVTEATSATRSTGSDKRPEGVKIQLQDLRRILSSTSAGLRNPSANDTKVELGDVLNVDNLRGLLEKPEIQARLLPHLPPLDPEIPCATDLDNLTVNIQSSQFKSTLKSFSTAFCTGELAPVLAQFNLGEKADEASRSGDLIAFSHALQLDASKSSSNESNTNSVNIIPTSSSDKAHDNSKDGEDKSGEPQIIKKDDTPNSKMDTD